MTETGILYRAFQKRRIMDKRMKLGKFVTANWRYPLSIKWRVQEKIWPRDKHKLKPWEVEKKKKHLGQIPGEIPWGFHLRDRWKKRILESI